MSDKISDKELVRRAAHGNKEAFRVLVEKYQSRAYTIAFGIVKTKQDAEDVVQEAFVKAYLSLPSFKGDSAFYTWFYRIVYNMSIDFKRKVKRQGGEPVEYDEIRTDTDDGHSISASRFTSPGDSIYRKEQAKLIKQCLEELSPEHRTVVVLREIDGLSYSEISKALGVNKGTVMSRLFYARKQIQERLQKLTSDLPSSEGEAGVVEESKLNILGS